jgi:hypothetical protein
LGAGASDDFLRQRLLPLAPDTLSEQDSLGWTLVQRVTAHQLKAQVTILRKLTLDRSDLWLAPWSAVDLRHPEQRSELALGDQARAWPPGRAWDTGIEWTPVSAEERATLTRLLGLELGASELARGTLSFYPEGVSLVRVSDPSWPNSRRKLYWAESGKRLLRLSGSSSPSDPRARAPRVAPRRGRRQTLRCRVGAVRVRAVRGRFRSC